MRQHLMWSILAGGLAVATGAGEMWIDGSLVGAGTTTYQCVSCWDGAFSALRPSCL